MEAGVPDPLEVVLRATQVQRESVVQQAEAGQHLRQAVAEQRHGPRQVLEIEVRTALLWEGYDLGLDTLALDMMHADFDLVTSLLGQPSTVHVTGTGGPDGLGG